MQYDHYSSHRFSKGYSFPPQEFPLQTRPPHSFQEFTLKPAANQSLESELTDLFARDYKTFGKQTVRADWELPGHGTERELRLAYDPRLRKIRLTSYEMRPIVGLADVYLDAQGKPTKVFTSDYDDAIWSKLRDKNLPVLASVFAHPKRKVDKAAIVDQIQRSWVG